MDNEKKQISVSLVGEPLSNDRIQDLQDKMSDYSLDSYELHITQNSANGDAGINYAAISEKTEAVFTKLKDVHCGVLEGAGGEFLLMMGNAQEPLSGDEKKAVENFLRAESRISEIRLQISQ